MNLPEGHMAEAEVSLRLAASLIEQGIASSDVHVALDGAHVKVKETVHFRIHEYVRHIGWAFQDGQVAIWQGTISRADQKFKIVIHSKSGVGDVVTLLHNGRRLRVESKKGPLSRSKSSKEYPLIQSAIGQLVTVESVEPADIMAVAVPSSIKFEALADRWRQSPLMVRANIKILTVSRAGVIRGLDGV